MPVARGCEETFTDHRIRCLFSRWKDDQALALAVSGGPDSIALMLMASRWRESLGSDRPAFLVLTVDHGLRAGSRDEALRVLDWAGRLGFESRLLSCKGWAGKERANIQARARDMRYRLLAAACHEHGISRVFTGHHLDDQVETVLLHLLRGSGVDGLSAMYSERLVMGVRLCRPLLGIARRDIVAFLSREGHPFIHDPSNDDARFARVRIRKAMRGLLEARVLTKRVGDTARRMQRAREGIDWSVTQLSSRVVRFDRSGFAVLLRRGLEGVPDEMVVRLLVRLLMIVGGRHYRPRACASERVLDLVTSGKIGHRTLHGCQIELRDDEIWIWREMGRSGLPIVHMAPGETGVWDGRFAIRLSAHIGNGVEIRALDEKGWRCLGEDDRSVAGVPFVIARSCPSAWIDDRLVAVPFPIVMEKSADVDMRFMDCLTCR